MSVCLYVSILNDKEGHKVLNETTSHIKWGPQLVAFYICQIYQMFGTNSLLKPGWSAQWIQGNVTKLESMVPVRSTMRTSYFDKLSWLQSLNSLLLIPGRLPGPGSSFHSPTSASQCPRSSCCRCRRARTPAGCMCTRTGTRSGWTWTLSAWWSICDIIRIYIHTYFNKGTFLVWNT